VPDVPTALAKPLSPGAGPGIYPPREDTFLLLPYAQVEPGTKVLEIGTGSGLLALTAARRGGRVVATDRNPFALRALLGQARHEPIDLEVVRTELARGLDRFDRILVNPPYLPTRPEQRDPDPWTNLALDGGPDGTAFLDRLLTELPRHLGPESVAFVLVSSLQDPEPLARLRARWLRSTGEQTVCAARELEGERLEVWRLTAR
jgi:release factor glutamine methyltransferase